MPSVFFSRSANAAKSQRIVVPRTDVDTVSAIVDGRSRLVTASQDTLSTLIEISKEAIDAPLAAEAIVRRVLERDPDCVWAFLRDDEIVGGVAFLMLTESGVEALQDGALNVADPAPDHLVEATEQPCGVYIWALVGWGRAAPGMSQGFVRLREPRYRKADLFASPYTDAGRRFTVAMGFEACARRENLYRFVRHCNRPAEAAPSTTTLGGFAR
jgi:hypothetical protein